ncbi:PQQ-dependent sugar dehydrogenase [Umezawaea sp.]|uniref:PQQ-dependent sugar dehydrogenase n=1 Tax=Umezawaea sp. TaxID=1955258 RepID=UPI002ED62004
MTAAAATALAAVSLPGVASAAPTRYEAENAALSRAVVESNHAGFSGSGFVNPDNTVGSSVEFTATAAQAGPATLTIRYANGTADNRPADVSVNGEVVQDDLAFPATGAWTTWANLTTTAQLAPGANKIRITSAGATGAANVDHLDVDAAGVPASDHESERATISQGVVESNWAGFSGTGFVNYDNVVGSSVEYTATVVQAGAHVLTFRYANGTAVDRPLAISANGGAATTVAFPPTGAWTTWRTAEVTLPLVAGVNEVRTASTTADGGPNADRLGIRFSGPADTERPQPPSGLRSTGKSATTVSLAWSAGSDNVGVTGYDVYQHGQLVTSVGNVLQATATGLVPDTEYDWTVFSKDAAGNVSAAGDNLLVRTDPAPPDTVAPTAPGTLRTTGKSATSVDLAWTASTDDVGVTGYEVFRDGVRTGTADGTATSTTSAGLTAGTEYAFTVRARDAQGNLSGSSNEIRATPSAGGPTGTPDPGAVSTLASGVDVAWGVVFLPDGSALFSERETFTVTRLTKSGQKTSAGRISQAVGTNGEGGLLGLEVSPTFATDHWLYVYHTAAEGNRVVRIKYENGALVQNTYQILLQGMAKNRYHNGGRLRFGPDGKLYISSGDAQNSANAQNNGSLNGKVLRINPDGSIPSDNPFGNAVWSKGHRNPQGLDFDSQGRLWEAEFGNTSQDEVNLITKGGNYGWPNCEGTGGSCAGFTAPKKVWATSAASPSGLTIVNDHVFVATTVGQRVYRMTIDGGGDLVDQKTYFQGTYDRLRTVEVDPDGDVWLTTTTDKDGVPDNDRVLLVDIVYAGGRNGATTAR